MRIQLLGDVLDHWKGSLIRILSESGGMHNLAVEPMITDPQPWPQEDLLTYRRLLNLHAPNIICHEHTTFSGERQQYFNDIQHNDDLFLDPDTGIYTGVGAPTRKHITVPEIRCLLERHETYTRLLIIYQHSARGLLREQVMRVREILRQRIRGTWCIAYEGGRAAMLFISKDRGRIQNTYNALRGHLNGTAANNRVLGHP